MTVVQAAKLLGKPPQFVRIALQKERLPIGAAVQMPGGRWSYLIIDKKLYEYIGKEDEQQ